MDKAYKFVLLLSVGMAVCSTASKVVMTTNPQIIIPILTKTLQLRCSVVGEPVQIIGRRDVTAYPMSETSTSQADVSHVTSIIITRMNPETKINVTVATVSSFDPPTAKVDLGKISVAGSTNPTSGAEEKGFLEVIWDHPLEDQDGVYFCDVYALNALLHPESLTVTAQVKTSAATLPDLVKYISENDRHIETLQARVRQLEDQISDLELKERNQTQELFWNYQTMSDDIRRLEVVTGNLTGQNIQTGNFTCPGSSSTPINVKFHNRYASVPDVYLALNNIPYLGYSIGPIAEVNTEGFRVACSSGSSGYSYGISWMAIDN